MSLIRLLTFTTLYPNAEQPCHGIFVEQRLRRLLDSGKVETRVVAPVPWFPFKQSIFGNYAQFARIPYREVRHDISVAHPRFPLPPKVGMTLAPVLLAAAVRPTLHAIINNGYDFDLIDAHYFYPDGVAAVMLARHFGKPVIITGRGSDINLITKYRLPRKMIVWAAQHAAGCVTVCEALKDRLVDIGAEKNDITILRNGVDLNKFHPIDRENQRQILGVDCITLLSVGNLLKLKGHDIVIKALKKLPHVRLFIVGEGEEKDQLIYLAGSLGVSDRVTFMGEVLQDKLKYYYGAADALVLASSREGWANVLLESMACGTPVLATPVGGTPEAIASPEAGVLIKERTPEGIVQAFNTLFNNYPDRAATRRYAEKFSWDETTQGQEALFAHVLGRDQYR